MKKFVKITHATILILSMIACNNNKNVKESKHQDALTTQEIDIEKRNKQHERDSLKNVVSTLKKDKIDLFNSNKTNLLKSEIKKILQKSNFDHVILGVKDLNEISNLFNNKLGFSIKSGKQHTNGINNVFIEFNDSTEIEFISVTNPTDKLSIKYASLIYKGKQGLGFALRTKNMSTLKSNFSGLDYGYENFSENKIYSTLSSADYQEKFPLFFIQYRNDIINNVAVHKNGVVGILSLWFSTNDISKTAKLLTEFGFTPLRLIKIPSIERKSVSFKNNNFEIILIESDVNKVSGITLEINDIEKLKNILKENKIENYISQNREQGKSIILDSKITKSVMIEFLEKSN